MSQIDPEALSATNNLHELAREWIEHLRTVLYHSRVLTHQPLPDEYPLSEDFPFVRRAFGTTFPPFRTRAHFDSQQSLGLTEEVVYSVSLEYHPGSPEYDANWRIICGNYVIGQLTLTNHIWQHETDMSWLSADRFLLTLGFSVTSKRKLRLTSRVWELQGNPPSEHIVSNLELFEIWTEEDSACHQVIGSRYIRARKCVIVGCGAPLHPHQEQVCFQHQQEQIGVV